MNVLTRLIVLVVCYAYLPITASYALKLNSPVNLMPHRAVYEMSLANKKSSSSISGLRGRLVFELGGSNCEGYTINMRFVTQVTDNQGIQKISDLRTSSWESPKGDRFRFNSSEYSNSKLSQITSGDAKRNKDQTQIQIRVRRPKAHKMNVSSKVLFPTQHSIQLIKAAQKGLQVMQADIYDGSEAGKKVYSTTAIIGKPQSSKNTKDITNGEILKKINSWPVSISYYAKKPNAIIPDYQIAFQLFENGVSQKLFMNYGEFSIKGVLKQIEFLKPVKCS